MSNSLWPHGLYSTWDPPDQNTGVGSLSLLQGIFPTQGSNPGLLHCRRILYQLSHRETHLKYMTSSKKAKKKKICCINETKTADTMLQPEDLWFPLDNAGGFCRMVHSTVQDPSEAWVWGCPNNIIITPNTPWFLACCIGLSGLLP